MTGSLTKWIMGVKLRFCFCRQRCECRIFCKSAHENSSKFGV